MKARPILITTSLIQPVLQDLKTLTSRLPGLEEVNERPDDWEWVCTIIENKTGDLTYRFERTGKSLELSSRYGQPGGQLWVRECWAASKIYDDIKPRDIPNGAPVWYAANPGAKPDGIGRLRPSIHMPRWMSRLSLLVNKIEPRRAHSLTEEECEREGVPRGIFRMGPNTQRGEFQLELDFHGTYQAGYKYTFATINGLEVWETNPWVWLISFTRVKSQPGA